MSISPFAVPNKQKMNFLLLALALLSVSSAVSISPKQRKSKTISIDWNLLQIIDFHKLTLIFQVSSSSGSHALMNFRRCRGMQCSLLRRMKQGRGYKFYLFFFQDSVAIHFLFSFTVWCSTRTGSFRWTQFKCGTVHIWRLYRVMGI